MHQDGMARTNVYVSTTVHHSGHIIDGLELVVVCGYSIDGRYGYFICLEDKSIEDATNMPLYKYSKQYCFFPKKDETSFAQTMQQLKTIITQ